jgi:hypothetical protein
MISMHAYLEIQVTRLSIRFSMLYYADSRKIWLYYFYCCFAGTFTQCVLTSMEQTLALDNYTYVGMGINPCQPDDSQQQLLQHCYHSMFSFQGRARIAPEGLSILRDARQMGRNAIWVNECFEFYTPDQIKVLATELRPSWNVKIIMNYRRVFEFLPSSFNQNLKPKKHVPRKYLK